MATTTRATLRQRLSEAIGDYHSVTSTSAGNSAATTIISTTLLDLPGGGDDDAFEGWYVMVTSGNNDAEIRRISSYIANDSTVTVGRAFSNATETPVTFEAWVYATAADTARIRILWGSGSYESHSYHDGVDEWQLQSISISIPSTATEVTAVLEVADGYTAYFDNSWLAIDPLYTYTLPTALTFGPNYVTQQVDRFDPNGPYHPLQQNGVPMRGRILRIEGLGMLSRPTTDSGTIEAGEPHISVIIAYALMFFNRLLLANSAQQQRDRFAQDMQMWGQEARSLMQEVARPKLGAKRSDGTWHVEEDNDGRYLIFDRNRYSATTASAR